LSAVVLKWSHARKRYERQGRHTETSYDELLASGLDRREARRQVEDPVRFILTTWQQP
jgi:hypothetical protein